MAETTVFTGVFLKAERPVLGAPPSSAAPAWLGGAAEDGGAPRRRVLIADDLRGYSCLNDQL